MIFLFTLLLLTISTSHMHAAAKETSQVENSSFDKHTLQSIANLYYDLVVGQTKLFREALRKLPKDSLVKIQQRHWMRQPEAADRQFDRSLLWMTLQHVHWAKPSTQQRDRLLECAKVLLELPFNLHEKNIIIDPDRLGGGEHSGNLHDLIRLIGNTELLNLYQKKITSI